MGPSSQETTVKTEWLDQKFRLVAEAMELVRRSAVTTRPRAVTFRPMSREMMQVVHEQLIVAMGKLQAATAPFMTDEQDVAALTSSLHKRITQSEV